MAAKEILFRDQALARMLRGVDILADAVKVTLGPRGRNVLLDQPYGAPRVTKDGLTVAKTIELEGKFENMGAQMLIEVAGRTNDQAGDGTTTAVVLAQAIAHEGIKAVVAGMNPVDLKRGIDRAVAAAVEDIQAASQKISTNEEIAQIATISANGEREIGQMVAKAMSTVGSDGVIAIEEAKGLQTDLEIVEGMQFNSGYASPYFVTDTEKLVCELNEPLILFCNEKLSGLQNLVPFLETVIKEAKPLLIVADDIDGEALAVLVVNNQQGILKTVAVKAPEFGDRRKTSLEDMAILCGGSVVSADAGTRLEDMAIAKLGRATKVRVDANKTTIIGGAGSKAAIDARVAQIRLEIDNADSDYEHEKLRERLAKLASGVAIIHVGGASEAEVKERKDRIDDAVHATQAAVKEGIVAGGGAALLHAVRALGELKWSNDHERVGIDIVRRALQYPTRQIAKNAGVDGSMVVDRLLTRNDTRLGFDAQTGSYVDMMEAGIVDPTKVIRLELQNAASVAGLLITTDAMIAEKVEEAVPSP